jgi:prolyl-tRNA editing enzyme YbaK/EbsC (Cys-tRNA(Pro) deacylase)
MAGKKDSVQTVEKFQKLAQLALSEEEGEPSEEARSAAVKAIQLLADKDEDDQPVLVVIPRAELVSMKKKLDGAGASLSEVKKAQEKGMMMGGILGFMLAGGKLGR